jgi:hypothetical protein
MLQALIPTERVGPQYVMFAFVEITESPLSRYTASTKLQGWFVLPLFEMLDFANVVDDLSVNSGCNILHRRTLPKMAFQPRSIIFDNS